MKGWVALAWAFMRLWGQTAPAEDSSEQDRQALPCHYGLVGRQVGAKLLPAAMGDRGQGPWAGTGLGADQG